MLEPQRLGLLQIYANPAPRGRIYFISRKKHRRAMVQWTPYENEQRWSEWLMENHSLSLVAYLYSSLLC
jgi:hypothetical protein